MANLETLHKSYLVLLICIFTLLVNNLLYATIIPALIFIIAILISVTLLYYQQKIYCLLIYGYALLIFFPYHHFAFNSYHSIGIWNWGTTPLGFIGLVIYALAFWFILPGKAQMSSRIMKTLRLLIIASLIIMVIVPALLLMWNRLL